MATDTLFDPDQVPPVAVASMNETHHEEVKLVNELARLLHKAQAGEPDTQAIDEALDRWASHTEAHFARENELMEKYGFPPYPVHAQEHAAVLDEIHHLQSAWRQQRELEPLVDFLFQRWPRWFVGHVNTMDTITAQFLSSFLDH